MTNYLLSVWFTGPVWADKEGATGFGCKLVVEWVKRQGVKGE